MASLSGVSRSNTVSSLMNSANMISGLASGLDTEGMIENLVKGYQTKISQLNQKVTKTEWKQESYRSIISKLSSFSSKYTSYTSNTNLTSPSFFSNAVKVIARGEFKDSVTASGKAGSDISLDAVHQLAKAAQYRTKSNLTAGEAGIISGSEVDLSSSVDESIELSNLTGSLTLTYGSKTVEINFDESTTAKEFKDIKAKLTGEGKSGTDAEVLAEYINQKLGDQEIVFNNGNSETADKRILATANPDGRIVITERGGADNGVYISEASGNIAKQLGLSEDDLKNAKTTKPFVLDTNTIVDGDKKDSALTRSLSAIDYLAEKGTTSMNMSLDGSTKTITMPKVGRNDDGTYSIDGQKVTDQNDFAQMYTDALAKSVKDAFGDKVTVANTGSDGKLQLEFTATNEGSELVINADVGKALGIGSTATSYLNTSKTLGELMGDKLKNLKIATDEKTGQPLLDEKTGKPQWEFTLNGKKIGAYSEDTKLSEIMSDINSNKEAGVQVSYSRTTQSFTFTAKETGANSKIEMGEGLAQAMFGSTHEPIVGKNNLLAGADGKTLVGTDEDGKDYSVKEIKGKYYKAYTNGNPMIVNGGLVELDASDPVIEKSRQGYTAGQDAIFTATINGEQKYMTRASNSVNIDGLTINMEETFNSKVDENGKPIMTTVDGKERFQVDSANKSVTFQGKTDSDKIVDAIKSMVDDYNVMMLEVKKAYSTMPYQKSDGSFGGYEPLTDEEREGMSESAIERYEEKAKQGILFGDRNLSGLYSKMFDAFSFTSRDDVDTLKDMGITVGYDFSTGAQAVQLDEEKLRSMLDSDPDRVADLFTKTDGVMDRMKTGLDYYAKTIGEPKGVLVQQSGTPLSSLSLLNNNWQQEIDSYTSQIEKWQDKLTSQVEKYTSQFSRLEQLIQQMNSQSSTLAGMMGG